MVFQLETQALDVMDDVQRESREREAAIRYVAEQPTPQVIQRLVSLLQDDHFGVRWEAAVGLIKAGDAALPEMLTALVDPHRVSDPRLREGAYHILHYNHSPEVTALARPLMDALKGPAAGITTLEAANEALTKVQAQQRAAVKIAANAPRSTWTLRH